MAQKKTAKNTKNNNCAMGYKIATLVLGILVIAFLITTICGITKKKTTDRYMDYYAYLLNQEVQDVCKDQMENRGKIYDCRFVEYGMAEDNNPFVTYMMVERNKDTYEIIDGSEKTYKLWLWQDESQKNVPGNWGVSRANKQID